MSTSADLEPWTVFKVGESGGKLLLTEFATVDAYAEDDAIISACERHGQGGRFVAMPESEADGRVITLSHNARFALDD